MAKKADSLVDLEALYSGEYKGSSADMLIEEVDEDLYNDVITGLTNGEFYALTEAQTNAVLLLAEEGRVDRHEFHYRVAEFLERSGIADSSLNGHAQSYTLSERGRKVLALIPKTGGWDSHFKGPWHYIFKKNSLNENGGVK